MTKLAIPRLARLACVAVGAAVLSGCMTMVDVQPYKGVGQEGFRYSLPEPYLLVKPKVDGTATYEWVYLPNKDNEYAVTTTSFLSSYKLVLKSENGFLGTASFKGASTAVPSKLADVIGDVAKEKKDAETAADKAAAKEVKDKAAADEKSANEKLAAADKALNDAITSEVTAQAEVDFYKSPEGSGATQAAILTANIALAKAKAQVAEMRRRRDALASSAGAQDAPRGAALAQQWGPMLFRLVPKADGGVELRAVAPQVLVQTSGTPPKQAAAGVKAEDSPFSTPKVATSQGSTTVSFVSSAPVTPIAGSPVLLNKGTDAVSNVKAAVTAQNEKALTVTFTPALGAGQYTAQIPYKSAAGQEASGALSFTVEK